jgi:hypothetical protein
VDALSTGPSSVVQQIRAGKMRALAHWGEGRLAAEDSRAKQALAAAGSAFQYQDAPEFDQFVQTDAKAMALVVQRIGRVE